MVFYFYTSYDIEVYFLYPFHLKSVKFVFSNHKRLTKLKISHIPSGELIAEGKKGWEIFPFEGNYYISNKSLKSNGFRFSGIPGLCFYIFIYFWYHFQSVDGKKSRMIAWKYWLPNPLFPFIAFRVAIPSIHPEIRVEEIDE